MSYKKLEVWQLAHQLVIGIHKMSLEKLPKFEMYETGSQIRRSSKSTKSAIVEGYGRRIYKQEFLKFLIYSISSNDETIDHLETLYDCKSLTDQVLYNDIHLRLNLLGKKLNNLIGSVQENHNDKSSLAVVNLSSIKNPISSIQHS